MDVMGQQYCDEIRSTEVSRVLTFGLLLAMLWEANTISP